MIRRYSYENRHFRIQAISPAKSGLSAKTDFFNLLAGGCLLNAKSSIHKSEIYGWILIMIWLQLRFDQVF